MALGSRLLNETGGVMGLNVYDLLGAMGVLAFSSWVLKPFGLDFLALLLAGGSLSCWFRSDFAIDARSFATRWPRYFLPEGCMIRNALPELSHVEAYEKSSLGKGTAYVTLDQRVGVAFGCHPLMQRGMVPPLRLLRSPGASGDLDPARYSRSSHAHRRRLPPPGRLPVRTRWHAWVEFTTS